MQEEHQFDSDAFHLIIINFIDLGHIKYGMKNLEYKTDSKTDPRSV